MSLGYLLTLTANLKSLPSGRHTEIFEDYSAFVSWIESVPRRGDRQFRHMLRYFAFPERVELSRRTTTVIASLRPLVVRAGAISTRTRTRNYLRCGRSCSLLSDEQTPALLEGALPVSYDVNTQASLHIGFANVAVLGLSEGHSFSCAVKPLQHY